VDGGVQDDLVDVDPDRVPSLGGDLRLLGRPGLELRARGLLPLLGVVLALRLRGGDADERGQEQDDGEQRQ